MENVKKRIGLLGFSANPPHNGHLEIANIILNRKLADAIWLIPCYHHSLSKPLIAPEHRWQMALLMEGKDIFVTNIEFRLKGRSYTIETVKALKREYPGCDFFWIVGSDIVKTGSYKRWKDWQELISSIGLLVFNRVDFKMSKLPPGFIPVRGRISNVSSTEVRDRVRRGLPIDDLVPPKVKKYIEKYGLYKS